MTMVGLEAERSLVRALVDRLVVGTKHQKTRVVITDRVDVRRDDFEPEKLGGQIAGYGGRIADAPLGDAPGAEGRILGLDQTPAMRIEKIDALQQRHRV